MRIIETLLHFFTPRHTNNHRAKALHVSSLAFYITLLLVLQIGLTAVGKFDPQILGYASNISVQDLLNDTNAARSANGDGPLKLNSELTAAASAKAADMFTNQYWAHISPSGRDPWSFITAAGYNYLFAGENLARDFADSQSVVTAWMNSPTHRDNLLNNHYQDVGFAVVNGKYGSYETTLVVQEFGTPASSAPTVEAPTAPAPPAPAAQSATPSGTIATPSSTPATSSPAITPTTGAILNLQTPPPSGGGPSINAFSITKTVSLALIVMLMGILAIDGILVYRRKTVRISGHNFAHLMMLLAVLVLLNLVGRGLIL